TRLKKQLVRHGLLKEVRIGRNRPNRLYPIIPNDVTGKGFIKIPQCFFTEKRYKNMSSIAKIVYSCLDARFNMSKENDYKDRYGNVCCKYSYKSIISFLNCSRYAFKKAKDELLALDLMKQFKDDFSYSMHYYMKSPNEKVIQKQEYKDESNQGIKTFDMSGHDKIEPRDTTKLNQNYLTFIYPTFNQLSTNVKSVMNIKSTSKETEHTNYKHSISDKSSINQSVINITTDEKERYLKQYPEQIALALKPYALKDAQNYMSIICNTKNQHNSEMGTDYSLEDMSLEIARTIDQVKRVMKRNGEKPEDMFGYLKVAIL
ncbi:replication initiator protein A, partial [Mycobacterium marinum]|uniref:replication initiator protein A n=1 Tax=Mycobacterium marinum TaxID=1781 RepID=UPI003569E218